MPTCCDRKWAVEASAGLCACSERGRTPSRTRCASSWRGAQAVWKPPRDNVQEDGDFRALPSLRVGAPRTELLPELPPGPRGPRPTSLTGVGETWTPWNLSNAFLRGRAAASLPPPGLTHPGKPRRKHPPTSGQLPGKRKLPGKDAREKRFDIEVWVGHDPCIQVHAV